ncbi:TPM domain-containing protein, partial [bacterium LRH843]|nr:TPM domain-containing protein [bacterium LRH843]
MIGHQQFLQFSYKWVLAFILSGLLCLSSLTWAEVATATDGAAET